MLTGFPVPAAQPGEQQWWEDAFDAWFFADRFGWTPAEVDELPVAIGGRLKAVTMLVEEIRAEKAKSDG